MAYKPMLSKEQTTHIRELLQRRNDLSKERRQIETEISEIEQEMENLPFYQKAFGGIKQLYNGKSDNRLSGLRRRLRDVEGQIEVSDTILRTPVNKNLQADYHRDFKAEKKWVREMEKKERENDEKFMEQYFNMPDSDDEHNFGFKAKRKSPKRKSAKRKSPKRKSAKRKSISRKKKC